MTNCSNAIEDDLRWREAELSSLKRLAIVNNNNEIIFRATLRACWALLYAHFEGFTKFTWELLLDHIQKERLPINKLSREFQLLALEKIFRSLRGDISSNSLLEFFGSTMPDQMQKQAVFPLDCRLETESNLWPNIFERECARIGVKSKTLESSRARIKALVSRRNDIAHGKKMTIKSVAEYTEYEKATLIVLHDLAIQVLDIIEEKTYVKPDDTVNTNAQIA